MGVELSHCLLSRRPRYWGWRARESLTPQPTAQPPKIRPRRLSGRFAALGREPAIAPLFVLATPRRRKPSDIFGFE
jgi:hypothetical protein